MSQVEPRSDAMEKCPQCFGVEGNHLPNCPEAGGPEEEAPLAGVDLDKPNYESDERNPAEGNDELPPPALEQNERGEMLPGRLDTPEDQLHSAKLPPSAEMLVGNELLWLIARTCHEVNRAYCAGVTSDWSHQPWDIAPNWQRESCYEGVLKHYHNPEFSPEDSHRSWMAKKIEDGWSFGNLKDETAKTHPNIVPYHTLHIHERTKDAIFSAICKSMLGGTR